MKIPRPTSLVRALSTAALLVASPVVTHAETGPPGDIPDNQAFVTFHGAGYSLKTPEGWARTQPQDRRQLRPA